MDTLWRLAARQEEGVAEGMVAGVVAEDVQSFFECIGRERLAEEAAALGFPLPVLKAAFAGYSMARPITLQGRVPRELHPTSRVIAGCSIAMALTKVFYLRAFDGFVARAPSGVQLDAYVDDLTLSAIGVDHRVIIDLTRAHDQLKTVVEEELNCRFPEWKTAVTATSRAVAAAIARHVGVESTGAPQCLLGIDNAAGAPRRKLKRSSKKAERMKAALARRKRLQALAGVIGHKANRVYRMGLQPAAAFDGPVWGVDQHGALTLRRLAATAMRPRARGRSLAMVNIWYQTPTADAENSPIVQLARMA